MPRVEVERTYLTMDSRHALRRADAPGEQYSVARETPCPVETYRALYRDVGRAYHWRDRLTWSDVALAEYLGRPDVFVWILRDGATNAGFFELVRQADGSVEIAYFGLLEPFFGRGLGKYLLTVAVDEAWSLGASQVWLHTCTLDGPAALPNYLARGFQPVRRTRYTAQLPD
jgi:GNAT superfamily N-acetyltransferase